MRANIADRGARVSPQVADECSPQLNTAVAITRHILLRMRFHLRPQLSQLSCAINWGNGRAAGRTLFASLPELTHFQPRRCSVGMERAACGLFFCAVLLAVNTGDGGILVRHATVDNLSKRGQTGRP